MTSALLTLLDDGDVSAFTEAGYWGRSTIAALVRDRAAAHPDKVAVIESFRTVTYAQLVASADRLAAHLHAHGARRGARVAVWLPSRAEVAVALLACSRHGYVCSPSLHRDHSVPEVVELLERMGACALIAQHGYGAGAEERDLSVEAGALASMRTVMMLDPDDPQAPFESLPESAPPDPAEDPNGVVYLAFTSGTTGRPKGVMHSDNTLLAPVRSLRVDWSLGSDTVVYSLSPLSHNLGFGAMILGLVAGGQVVVHDLPRGSSLADRLRATGATFAFGVPTHAIDLLSELRSGRTGLPALRGFRISGAPVPQAVAAGLLDLGVVPQSGFGMTEAGSHHYTLPNDEPAVIVGSSGRACAGYAIRIFAEDNHDVEVGPGEIGQIGGRGASLMLGYFDDQFATEASFNRSGWFLTGDLGRVDEDGCLHIVGRKKDLIIRGGHNIYPARIENLAAHHPAVAKTAVVPIPDERLGEKVCLAVVVAPGEHLTSDGLLDHLARSGLSRGDMPEWYLEVPELPLLPSGKVFKRGLSAAIAEGREVPVAVRYVGAAGS